MDWKEKTIITHKTVVKNWPPWSDEDRRFLALAMAGEVGELLNLIKKDWRGDLTVHTLGAWRDKVREELADIRIYLELVAHSYDINLDMACEDKMKELFRRWPEALAAVKKELEKR